MNPTALDRASTDLIIVVVFVLVIWLALTMPPRQSPTIIYIRPEMPTDPSSGCASAILLIGLIVLVLTALAMS
jgi:hypothetical protein